MSNVVLGQSLLEFVRDVADRGINFWAENSSELDRGWARVLMEGQAMQQTDDKHVPQNDKKRGVRRNSSLIGQKGNTYVKTRSKALAKTPLDIVKTNPAAKKMIEKPAKVQNTSLMAGEISLREVDDVCVKISSLDFQKNKSLDPKINRGAKDAMKHLDHYKSLVHHKPTDHEKNTAPDRKNVTKNHKTTPKMETSKLAERPKKSIKSSKSSIIKTHEALTNVITSSQKEDVNLGDLIRRNASSSDDSRYFSCLDYIESLGGGDLKKSAKSSSSNYEIENARSLNSSLVSTNSIKNGCGSKTPSKANEIAYLMNKYKKTREYLSDQFRAEEEKLPKNIEQKTERSVGKISQKSSPYVSDISSRIPATTGIPDARTLDPRKSENVEQSNSKSSLVPKTSLLSSKFLNPSQKSRSKLKTESALRKKQKKNNALNKK